MRLLVRSSAAVLATALVAACSSSSSHRAASTQTTVGSAPPTTASPDTAVLSAYRAFWDGYLAAANPMNPNSPALLAHAAGQELENLQKAFIARHSAGEVIRGTLDLAPKVTTIHSDHATVSDCYGDNTHIYDSATGAQVDTTSGTRHLVSANLQLFGATWKVVLLTHEADGCTAS